MELSGKGNACPMFPVETTTLFLLYLFLTSFNTALLAQTLLAQSESQLNGNRD
jgi:hypothetical protein